MKEEILKSSLQHFLQYGIREMSNQKLVELLGISTKTIYKHFKNKEELLEEALYLFHAQVQESLKNFPINESAACQFYDFWHKAVMDEYYVNDAFFRDLHFYFPEFARKIEAATKENYKREFLRIIQRGIEVGSFRKDIMKEIVLENIFLQYGAIARSDRFRQFGVSADNILQNTIATTVRGICTAKGVKELDEHLKTHHPLMESKKSTKKVPLSLKSKQQ